jgi:molybdopterin synthase sulfur carrier subunit
VVVTVFIPTMLQSFTGGAKLVEMDATTVRQIINRLDELYPGIKNRLVKDDRIKAQLSVAIDGEVSRLGLMEHVPVSGEVHFIPAIGGGRK